MSDKNKNDIKKRLEELRKDNNRKKSDDKNNNSPFFSSQWIFAIIIIITFMFMFSGNVQNYFQLRKEITYSEFINKIKDGTFKEIIEKDEEVTSKIKENNKDVIYTTRKTTSRIGNDPIIIGAIEEKKASLIVAKPSGTGAFLLLLMNFLPLIVIIGISVYFLKKMTGNGQGGGPGGIFGFGKSRTEKLDKKPNVNFSDVAGVDGAKEELKEVVDFLKNPEKYTKAGARVPKGVLLLGRPGTGKTLLAKAVAGESGASFFSLSGSEFVEMFVGVGASRVRDLFEKAKSASPSIIFIDEIDAIGRKRSSGRNSGSNDEREQTLNQLLVEMDGFETDTKVIVIAATNREDVLDPALLRAGRFDRRVTVDAPDVQGRIAILNVHARNKKLSDDVRIEDIAKITPGFVGADLENLLNESAILAARRSSDTITMEDLDEAVDKIGMGLGQKGRIIKPEEKKLLAYHEAGHAVVSELTPGADAVHKVTIIPRGYAGGFMMPLSEEKLITTRKEMLAEIKVLFGGRVAEELILDDISTGAHNDIKRATNITRLYVESLGMSKKIGPVNFENSNEEFNFVSNKSNETAREIDMEIMRILSEEYQNTLTILSENRWRLDNVAELLLKKETITGAEVRKIINGMSAQDILDEDDRKIEEAKQKEEKKEQEEEALRKKEEEIAEAARLEAEEIEKKKLEEEKLMEDSKSQDEENDDIDNINDDQDNSNEEQIKEKKEIEIPNFMR